MFSTNCGKVAKYHLRNDEHNELYWSILTMAVSCRYEATSCTFRKTTTEKGCVRYHRMLLIFQLLPDSSDNTSPT
jgi:hypothetical protein